jgi:putative membrane protein
MMHGGTMMDEMGEMSLTMGLFMFLLWGFAILGFIVAVRWLVNRGKTGTPTAAEQTPLDLLKQRYAGGGIDREEFERMKKDLK